MTTSIDIQLFSPTKRPIPVICARFKNPPSPNSNSELWNRHCSLGHSDLKLHWAIAEDRISPWSIIVGVSLTYVEHGQQFILNPLYITLCGLLSFFVLAEDSCAMSWR